MKNRPYTTKKELVNFMRKEGVTLKFVETFCPKDNIAYEYCSLFKGESDDLTCIKPSIFKEEEEKHSFYYRRVYKEYQKVLQEGFWYEW